jgi:hypothetical protein
VDEEKEGGEKGDGMLISSAATRGNEEERTMRAETRQCCVVPFIESGQGLILGHLGGTGFTPLG